MDVDLTRKGLYQTSTDQARPQPRLFHHDLVLGDGTTAEEDAFCAGSYRKNGFYGRGIVNAYLAAGGSRS